MEKYLLHCASCGHKVFTDGKTEISSLVEIKSAPIPSRANGTNKETAKTGRKFKCPQCGMVLKPSALPAPPSQPTAPHIPDMDERSAKRQQAKNAPKVEDFLKDIDALVNRSR